MNVEIKSNNSKTKFNYFYSEKITKCLLYISSSEDDVES